MLWQFLRFSMSFFIPVFYRRVRGHNIHLLDRKGPVIIAMNHPNAFTDPIAITFLCFPLRTHYMARGDAFKPGLIAYLLRCIGIIPIFRLQDAGREGLSRNDDSYRAVNDLLRKNAKVIVFAEGLCIQERRLRPLKKGVARMVFGAYGTLSDDRLTVVPVGVNYSAPDKFRSDIFYNVGEPIPVKPYMQSFRENPARTYNEFLKDLEAGMKGLITHINDPADDDAVVHAEILSADALSKRMFNGKNDAYHRHQALAELTQRINQADRSTVEEFKRAYPPYFAELKKHRLKDGHVSGYSRWSLVLLPLRILLLVCGSPVFLTGVALNILPFLLVRYILNKTVKVREFYSSVALGAGAFIYMVSYLLYFIIARACDLNIWISCFIVALSYTTGILALFYYPFMMKTRGILLLALNSSLKNALIARRQRLLALINKF